MNDYVGRKLSAGDLVLFIPHYQNNFYFGKYRYALIVGENSIFKTRLLNSCDSYTVEDSNDYYLIKLCPLDTEELKKAYNELVKQYNIYTNNLVLSSQYNNNIKSGDIVLKNIKSTQKYVYIGYGNFNEYHNVYQGNEEVRTTKGYFYILGGLFTSKNSSRLFKDEVYDMNDIYYRMLMSTDSSEYRKSFLVLKEPMSIKEIYGHVNIINIESKYIHKESRYFADGVGFKKTNIG